MENECGLFLATFQAGGLLEASWCSNPSILPQFTVLLHLLFSLRSTPEMTSLMYLFLRKDHGGRGKISQS